jgi:hypothetical protein
MVCRPGVFCSPVLVNVRRTIDNYLVVHTTVLALPSHFRSRSILTTPLVPACPTRLKQFYLAYSRTERRATHSAMAITSRYATIS